MYQSPVQEYFSYNSRSSCFPIKENNNQYTAEKTVWLTGTVFLSGFSVLYSTNLNGGITVLP